MPTYRVAQTAELFKPNTVLWTLHTIQPSSFDGSYKLLSTAALKNCEFSIWSQKKKQKQPLQHWMDIAFVAVKYP